MSYNPDDYDEIYETTSEPEKAQLLDNGWVLLDERIEKVGGESFVKTWERTALSYTGGGLWSGAGREQPQPAPPSDQTTYVLGWPKGQQTITEGEFEAEKRGRTAEGPSAEAATVPSVERGSPDEASDAPSAPTAPSPPQPPDEV